MLILKKAVNMLFMLNIDELIIIYINLNNQINKNDYIVSCRITHLLIGSHYLLSNNQI